MTELERAQLHLACLQAAKETHVEGFANTDLVAIMATAAQYLAFVLGPKPPRWPPTSAPVESTARGSEAGTEIRSEDATLSFSRPSNPPPIQHG